MPPPPPVSPPALTPAPAAGEEGPPPLPEAGDPGCSGSRPPELEPERSLGRLRGRFEDEDEELEEEKRRLLETLQTENTVKRTPLKNKKQEGQVCVDGESCTEEVVKKARPKPRKRVVRKSKTEERK